MFSRESFVQMAASLKSTIKKKKNFSKFEISLNLAKKETIKLQLTISMKRNQNNEKKNQSFKNFHKSKKKKKINFNKENIFR